MLVSERAAFLAALLPVIACHTQTTVCPDAAPEQAADGPAVPATAAPSDAAPRLLSATYDPASDPRNDPETGWDFVDRRDPLDPAARKREPFTIDTLYALRSVGAPQWSPDGERILFTATRYDLAAGEQNTDIYLVRADGTGLRAMTRFEGSDGSPRWLPDGRSFVFVSARSDADSEGAQLWRMAIDGGEPERLTGVSTGVGSPEVSPDGARVAFVTTVFPEHGDDDLANAEAGTALAENPIQAHIADDLLYRHWTAYADLQRSHIFVLELESGAIADVTPGDFDSPAFGGSFAFSPDGKELCFESNRDPNNAQAWTTNKDLFVVPLVADEAGPRGTAALAKAWAEPLNITDANEAYDGAPAYSPDGRYIAFRRQTIPAYESDRARLAVYDRERGETTVLTEGFDNWVTDLAWAPDSASVIFEADVEGRTPLFRVEREGGAITKLALPAVRSWDVGPAGALAFTHSGIGTPVELYTADAQGRRGRRLTGFNDAIVERVDMRPAEELWIESKDGRKVHTWLVKPHGFDPKKTYPLIVNVHGGPQSQWQDSFRGDWQVYPGSGYVLAFPNPTGSSGYGQDYTAAISKDWGGAVFEDVMAVVEHLAAEPYVDDKRVGAMGWSYGGYMMNWLLGHTDRFAAIASMMGIYELDSFYGATEELWFPEWDLGGPAWENPEAYAKWSPSTYADKFVTPTLIVTGELDYRVPYTQSLQLFTALRRKDVPARLIVFPNDGHWPSHVRSMPLYYAAHLDWFHRYLGGEPSPYDPEALVRGTAFEETVTP